MIELIDDLSRTIRFKNHPKRIVCLVPSITETLFALGAGARIAAITDYCIHPEAEVCTKTRIGGTKNFHVDRILGLKPDLVIANAEENRKHQVEKLEEAGLHVFVTFPRNIDGCMKMIADMGVLTGTESAARRILDSIAQARTEALVQASEPPLRVLCPIWKDPYMTVNHDTFVDSVIRNCGGQNIFADSAERYPQFMLEEAARRNPEVVLLPTEPYHFSESDVPEFEKMWSTVPSIRDRRVHIVEGELLSWYGPRLARAFVVVSQLLRPH